MCLALQLPLGQILYFLLAPPVDPDLCCYIKAQVQVDSSLCWSHPETESQTSSCGVRGFFF